MYILRNQQLTLIKSLSYPYLFSYTQGHRLPGYLRVSSKQVPDEQQNVKQVNKPNMLLTTKKEDVPAFHSFNRVAAVGLYGTRDEKFERLLVEPVVNLQVCMC